MPSLHDFPMSACKRGTYIRLDSCNPGTVLVFKEAIMKIKAKIKVGAKVPPAGGG